MRAHPVIAGAALLIASIGHAQTPCDVAPGEGRGAIHGIAQDSTTHLPLQMLAVELSWEERAGHRRTVQRQTDRSGAFAFCDVPAAAPLRVESEHGQRNVQTFEVASGESRRIELTLDAAKTALGGKVLDNDNGRGIGDVAIRIRGSNVSAVSSADGSFRLPDIPAGVYWIDVSHVAYAARADTVRVTAGVRTLLTIRVAESVIALRPIEVDIRSLGLERTGFYDRRGRGFGSFMTRAEWDARAPLRPTDVLRAFAGVRLVPRRDGPGSTPLDRSNCAFRYVLDGVRVGSSFQMDDIPVEWLDAIEVYRGASTVPPQFAFPSIQPRANCGVIVIWTRRPR